MKLLVAKNSGFCFGVRRAVDICHQQAGEKGRVYSWGKIIHNEGVVEALRQEGVIPVESLKGLASGDTLIIRAHGATPELFATCQDRGIEVVDATCPFVKRIHRIVAKARQEGLPIYIAGKRNHPEVIGIAGWAGEGAVILGSVEEAEAVPAGEQGCLVAQTTFSRESYEAMGEILRGKIQSLTQHPTICDTTRARQQEAEMLSRRCSKMLVLGSQTSANTMELAKLCRKNCPETKTIENIAKISLEIFNSDDIIGLVAGASTPDPMIREVIQGMSELEQTTIETIEAEAPAEVVAETTEQPVEAAVETVTVAEAEEAAPAAEPKDIAEDFEAAIDSSIRRIRPGQVVKGTVIGITDNEVLVNVGYKSDGYIPRSEFVTDEETKIEDLVKEGDTIDAEVVKVNDGEGNVLLSQKNIQTRKIWDALLSEENEGKIFEAVVKEVVKGGLIAEIEGGVRAFIPASHVSVKYVEKLDAFVGKNVKVKVLEVDKQRKRIVASIKQVIIEEAAKAEQEKWDALVVGSKIHGVVRRITDFGAFVDIGGLDGLVHVTDVGWGRVKHPNEILSVNQEVDVLVLGVDKEKKRISLGYKQLQPKPWTMAAEKYPVGSIVEGKVVRIVPFGAFVALEPTIDGLIHISHVAIRRIEKVEDELKVGDVVRCKVLEVAPEAKRISLSRKEAILEENPEIAEQLAAEKAERERVYQERKAQREARNEQNSNNNERRQRSDRPAGERRNASNKNEEQPRRESRPDRRRRNSEDGEYELPPVSTTTTSLADLFAGFKVEE